MSVGTMNFGAAGQNGRNFLMIVNEKIKPNQKQDASICSALSNLKGGVRLVRVRNLR